MQILTFSSLYPNNVDPSHGIFVERRLRRLAAASDIRPTVVAPVPWFPFRAGVFGGYGAMARICRREQRHDIDVRHPRYPLLPRIGMNSAPRWMARGCRRAVRDCVRECGAVLIDAHYFYPDGVAASLIARDLGLPYLITARGSDVNLIARYASPRKQMLAAASGAYALIAVSEALSDAMQEIGMPRDRIRVLRNGVDLAFFQPGDGAAGGGSPRGQKFLSVGDLKREKGHDIAIRFIAADASARLVVVGHGRDDAYLRALARELGVEQRVEFTGTLEPGALRDRYRAADALILMSVREGMPNVVLESLACGTPVLGSNVGGIPEMLRAPEAGEIAASRTVAGLQDAWSRLSARNIERAQTREFAEQFSWDATIRELSRLMHDAAARGGH